MIFILICTFFNLNIFAYKKNKNLSEKHCNKLRSFKAASFIRGQKKWPRHLNWHRMDQNR